MPRDNRDRALLPDVRPLDESRVLVGRAKTTVWAAMHYVPDRPYDKEIAAVDSLQPGQVMVMAVGRSPNIVPWGELLTTACVARGARGAVLDGLVRDSRRIREMGFPVFCAGRRPYDSRGRGIVVDLDVPIAIDGVAVHPGDLVFGDSDGVVIVPRAVETEVLERAWVKIQAEDTTRDELRTGTLAVRGFSDPRHPLRPPQARARIALPTVRWKLPVCRGSTPISEGFRGPPEFLQIPVESSIKGTMMSPSSLISSAGPATSGGSWTAAVITEAW